MAQDTLETGADAAEGDLGIKECEAKRRQTMNRKRCTAAWNPMNRHSLWKSRKWDRQHFWNWRQGVISESKIVTSLEIWNYSWEEERSSKPDHSLLSGPLLALKKKKKQGATNHSGPNNTSQVWVTSSPSLIHFTAVLQRIVPVCSLPTRYTNAHLCRLTCLLQCKGF